MQLHSVADQCQHEHEVLKNVKDALRVTLNWRAPSVGLSRKLSSVLFIIRALQRHLERQIALEESGGYMAPVEEVKPSLHGRTDQLRAEHDLFRETLRELLPTVEQLRPEDETRFEQLCGEISGLLERIEQHDAKEVELLQDALLEDVGGEG